MHPHPSRRHIMVTYLRFILGEKRRAENRVPGSFRRGARALIHYQDYVAEYLEAKRDITRGPT